LLANPHKTAASKPLVREEKKTYLKVVKTKETPVNKEANKNKARGVSMTTSSKGNVNIQDQFLNHVRREKAPVTIHQLDGKEIHGHIKSFDNFCIQLESGSNSDILVYKHGISSISPSKVSDYAKKD